MNQVSDFVAPIDHIIISTTKSNYMYAGQILVPIIFRGANGTTATVGAQHYESKEELAEEFISWVFAQKWIRSGGYSSTSYSASMSVTPWSTSPWP